MNFFFGVKNSIIDSKLTIPRFQNSNPTKKEYMVFQLEISNQRWEINNLSDVELNRDFYKIDSNQIDNGNIFFLATQDEIQEFKKNNICICTSIKQTA